MQDLSSRIVITLQSLLGFLLGLFSWWNLSSVYWKKDLELPMNLPIWMSVGSLAGLFIILTLSALGTRTIGDRGWRLFLSSALSSASGLALVNFITPAVFTLLGGESSIYFLSGIGLNILLADTVFLLVIGSVIGFATGLIALLANRLVSGKSLP
jgi:hypothetical protein